MRDRKEEPAVVLLSAENEELPPSIGPNEVAYLFNVSVRQVQRLAREGVLPGFRVGKLWRFHTKTILRMLDGR